MNITSAFARALSFTKKKLAPMAIAGLGLAFSTPAKAGDLYDLCLTFVVDTSTSAQPKGWQGQIRGIAAGLRDHTVVSKVGDMHTGMRVNFIAFSRDLKRMDGAVLKDSNSMEAYAQYVESMQNPFTGSNNLYGALDMAHQTFREIEAEGHECLYKVVDFSGDGADASAGHESLQQRVHDMAADRITIHGLSFYDLVFGKYRTKDSAAWNAADKGLFENIHHYYKNVIVTPAGLGVRAGDHYTIDNQNDINTEGSIIEQITDLMRRKVVNEVAYHDARPTRTRFAGAKTGNGAPQVLAMR